MPTPPTTLPPLTPVICGPTAGGKSELAIELAITLRQKHGIPAQIITADAFQVYTGLDIGTAKPTVAERRGVPHHLVDIVPPPLGTPVLRTGSSPFSSPTSSFAAAHERLAGPGSENRATQAFTLDAWLARANSTIADLRSRNILPIVVGGTHLYIKALLEGLFNGPEPDHQLRAQLAAMDPAERRKELERVDPLAAERIHPNDIRRTIRALEVFRLTGTPMSAHQTQWDRREGGKSEVGSGKVGTDPSVSSHTSGFPRPTSDFLLITLDWHPDALNRRINARVKQMMELGLLDEVRSLMATNCFTPQSAEALGYKQLIPLVRAASASNIWPPPAAALEEAVEKIKAETRRFAKNQRTWLRRLSTIPGAIKLAAPTTVESPRDNWLPRILTSLGLPS